MRQGSLVSKGRSLSQARLVRLAFSTPLEHLVLRDRQGRLGERVYPALRVQLAISRRDPRAASELPELRDHSVTSDRVVLAEPKDPEV